MKDNFQFKDLFFDIFSDYFFDIIIGISCKEVASITKNQKSILTPLVQFLVPDEVCASLFGY